MARQPTWAEQLGIVAPQARPGQPGPFPGVVAPLTSPPRQGPAPVAATVSPLIIGAAVVAGLLWWRR